MRKLIVTCECGQRLRVPYSALGRMGMCAACGRKMRISSDNARRDIPNANAEAGQTFRGSADYRSYQSEQPTQADKERFGRAVDLYAARQYGEALAMFDELAQQFPNNLEIEQARQECLKALRGSPPALGYAERETPREKPEYTRTDLTIETIREVVLDKLLNGTSDAVQLEAARIAFEYLDLTPVEPTESTDEPSSDEVEAPKAKKSKSDRRNGNGKATDIKTADEEESERAPENN